MEIFYRVEQKKGRYSLGDFTELGYKVVPRLRELTSAAGGSQEARFTQPRVYHIAKLCILIKF